MRRRSRRRRFSAMGIWFVILACIVISTVWKFDWLPIEFGDAETGSLVGDATADEHNSSHDRGGNHAGTISVDPIIFDAQTEPPVGEIETDQSQNFAGRRPQPRTKYSAGSLIAKKWDDPVVPSLPAHFPAVPKTAQSSGQFQSAGNRLSQRRVPGNIVQVANESERKLSTQETAENRTQTDSARRTRIEKTATATPARKASSSVINLAAIDLLIEEGDDVTAHRELSKIYWNQPDQRSVIQERIDKTARSIYFSLQPHYMEPYVIQPADQMRKIAKQYHVPWEYLAKLNQIDPRRIRAGQKLKVIKGPFSAVVDLSDFVLTIHAHGYYVRRYLVGIGKDGRSPLGRFLVVNKVVNPQYTDPDGQIIDSDDPDNPLGERWIDIGDGFGIHGTIDPKSIGKAESRGCIRLHNSDIAEVYDLLDLDSEIIIRE